MKRGDNNAIIDSRSEMDCAFDRSMQRGKRFRDSHKERKKGKTGFLVKKKML